VRTGALPVGTRLPPIRQLAGDLGLAAGTVARVYRELETAGVLSTARRAGTVVAAVPEAPSASQAHPLAELAADYATRAAALGADAETAAAAVHAAWPAPADVPDQPPGVSSSWHDH